MSEVGSVWSEALPAHWAQSVEVPRPLTGALCSTTTVNQPKLALANSNAIEPQSSQRELGLGSGQHQHENDDAR